MSDAQVNSVAQENAGVDGIQPLNAEEISQLLSASSLSAARPLLGLIKFLIGEGVVDGEKLKAFLSPMLVADGFSPVTKAMLDPIWKSLLRQLDDSKRSPPL